jgi:hypothetical protein
MLVVLRLAARAMEPAEQSQALVATLCGYSIGRRGLRRSSGAAEGAARWAMVKGNDE